MHRNKKVFLLWSIAIVFAVTLVFVMGITISQKHHKAELLRAIEKQRVLDMQAATVANFKHRVLAAALEEEARKAEEARKSDKSPSSDLNNNPTLPIAIVNKQRPVNPIDYVPAELVIPEGVPNQDGEQRLVPAAAAAASMMYRDVSAATGAGFTICSGFRSYDLQKHIYEREIVNFGQAQADAYVAKPGHSEHQLGLAMDIMGDQPESNCSLGAAFSVTEAGKWIQENAYEYGFILRYQEGIEHITGYSAEEWHWRYVGSDVAKRMRDTGVRTLEELYGLV